MIADLQTLSLPSKIPQMSDENFKINPYNYRHVLVEGVLFSVVGLLVKRFDMTQKVNYIAQLH